MSEEVKKIPAIYSSLAAVQDELGAIKKDSKGYNYMFRGIDQCLNALNPLMKKHKIVLRRENLEFTRQVRQTKDKYGKDKEYVEATWKCDYIFTSLIDGSELRTSGMNEGQDASGGDKAISCATSNALKYVIFELFLIPTEEQKDSDQMTAIENGVDPKEEASSRGNKYRKTEKKGVL